MKSQKLYLQEVLARIRLIEQFTVGGYDAFNESPLIQEAVIRCFEVIGEVVKRISPELLAAHPQIPWRQVAGFRDVLIHDYDETDFDVVWRVVEEDLHPMKEALEAMLRRVEAEDE